MFKKYNRFELVKMSIQSNESGHSNLNPKTNHTQENADLESVMETVNSIFDAEIDNNFDTTNNTDLVVNDSSSQSNIASTEIKLALSSKRRIVNALADNNMATSSSTSSILVANELLKYDTTKRQKIDNEDTNEIPQNMSSSSEGIANDNVSYASSNFSSVTPRPKSPYVYDSTQDTRMEFLTRSPQLMQDCVNGYDFEGLQTLIDEVFLADCKFKTAALPQELEGRHIIMKYWESLTAMPDLILIFKSSVMNPRVISVKSLAVGTSVFRDCKNDYFYNFLKYGEVSDADKELKLRVDAMIEAKKQISFTYRSILHLVLNESKTHIERFVATRGSLEVEECSPQVTSTK